ncbi:nucleoside triphosphate pyrophosphohydrolase family protein [Sphingomonas sp. CARO-RG-8B-R24-01]|uniref:nucleoside triphosphate pyrophosphohydrolase family protein n=1 Tax=Sphingomonas sp. CARO-RG-8B-R24-01 TaxID=2914831 RepID=UPI001F55CE1E|nr:nucleoside triphosphate pyrophosphohydrolase family protein [Sphingomonas sp. CARO-RG-8B-R24-01]
MDDDFAPLTIAAYAAQALSTDQRSDAGSVVFPMLGLFGETGSLLSEVKKKQRDRASYLSYADTVVEELGDVLWYMTVLASRVNIGLDELFANVERGFGDWKQGGAPSLSFDALQPAIMARTTEPSPAFENTLLSLAGQVGLLVNDQQTGQLSDNRAAFAGRLVPILRSILQAANEAGVTLEAAAIKNLAKIFDRWPHDRRYPEPFDAAAPADEQLPRTLTMDIFERKVGSKDYVFQRCNGINIGDRLTDNALYEDHYRFHDVFHLAHVAVLGWSPVIRSLLRLKRKSDPAIDEAEDGARATLIEEGITTWIFGQAKRLDFFDGMKPGQLPFDLLKHIRQFIAGYEAESCPLWLWEEAILEGYAAFRFLRKHGGGRVHVDMLNHRLRIEALP